MKALAEGLALGQNLPLMILYVQLKIDYPFVNTYLHLASLKRAISSRKLMVISSTIFLLNKLSPEAVM